MKFSRNPKSGEMEIYTDDGVFLGVMSTMGGAPADEKSATDGGPGSGNFGHKGRPGKIGGSSKEGGSGPRSGSGAESRAPSSEGPKVKSPKMAEEPFDIWSFEDPDDNETEAKNASAAQEAFKKVAETYHMKGIVEAARKSCGDYKKFVQSMTPGQKDALRWQYRTTGSEEYFPDYVKRMQKMLAEADEIPDPVNKVVDGKDIVSEYKYMGREPTGVAGSEEIDTTIEDVLRQQGFDGVPKVVSRDEFDKIAREHPEMPILIRAYTAENGETLKKYSDDLERGHFYVDCGVGGSQYGQGMYCSGIYIDTSYGEEETERQFAEGMRSAEREADHYLQTGISRIMENGPSNIPRGMSPVYNIEDDSCFYYDAKAMKPIHEGLPENGTVVAVRHNEGQQAQLYYYSKETFKPIGHYGDVLTKDNIFRSWAPVEGRVATFTPQGTVRKMTLDPSAKIITYDELRAIKEGDIPPSVEEKASADYFDKKVKSLGLDESEAYVTKNLFLEMCGFGSHVYEERHAALEEEYEHTKLNDLEKMAREIHHTLYKDVLFDLEQEYAHKGHEITSKFRDLGAIAAALGYDAINAEGHGQTMSYTVVLNRTKVILQKEPM